ncbi:MAG TPA: 4Fe-4S binding protein, partial [Anaeromyxobacteraceae bacterium]|nr:4Fe-4S binding protein [Anaeromyxobacteraceae bacterium]
VVARGRCPVATPAEHGRLEVAEARCNRCGACLRLGCPAISEGFEAMAIDPALCQGCGVCAQACRAGAIARVEERA